MATGNLTSGTDLISGTVDRSSNVAIGKEINFSVEGGGDMPDREKLDEVYRLVYRTNERLAKLEVWMVALTCLFGFVALVGLVAYVAWLT